MIGEVSNPLEGGASPVAIELVCHGVVAVHAVQPGFATFRIMGESFLCQFLEAAVGQEVLFKVVLFRAVPLTCPSGVLLVEPLCRQRRSSSLQTRGRHRIPVAEGIGGWLP